MAGTGIRIIVKTNKFDSIAAKIPDAKRRRAQRSCDRIVAISHTTCPRKTGYLDSRTQAIGQSNGDGAVINDAPYASFVHEGTYKMAPRPWLAQSAELDRGEYVKDWTTLESDLA